MKDSWKLYYFLPVMCSRECDTRSRFTEYAVGKRSVLEVQKETLCWTEPVDIYLLKSSQWQFTLYIYLLHSILPFEHYDSNSFVLHNPLSGRHYLLNLQFHFEPGVTASRFWRRKQLPRSPLPYHHVAPTPPPFLSLLASVRRFEGNHKCIL